MSRFSSSKIRGGGLIALKGPSGGHSPGEVWLVGAGPGDPDLLTVRALKVLQRAQVILHDGLVSEEILSLAPPQARRINVAKRKSRHTLPQEEINRLLVALALDGRCVVRLKGGDPFVFGRGGEELEACRAAGVPCHVVPGVTAALAACATAGAPLTHRGLAQSATVITAHAKAGETPDLDWAALARPNHTVAVYMGLSAASAVQHALIAAGRDPATPVLIAVSVSRPQEQRIVTTLGQLSARAADLSGPAVLIVGEAMALAMAGEPAIESLLLEAAQ